MTLAHYEIRILASSGSIALLIAHNAISQTFPLFEAREEKEKEENERERKKNSSGILHLLSSVLAFAKLFLLCQIPLPFGESRFSEPTTCASRHPR